MPLSAGARLGPYEIVAPLGSGGMGEVYRATDTNLKRQVAIKVLPASLALDADRLARFQREAEVLAALNHPHIAQIYGLEKSSSTNSTGSGHAGSGQADAVALVMELVEGEDLWERIARGPIPLDEALAIARQIADAVESAHEQGIIHRDLKPANIKVRPDGTVKVLDFGLAKALAADGGSAPSVSMSPTLSLHATMAGVILGTAAYMSPEQARGRAVDKRSDIWAFGVVLLEMLTGQRAFKGDDVSITLASVLMQEPEFGAVPAATPAALRRLLARCLKKDPRARLRDIGEARIVIDDIIAGVASEEIGAGKAVAEPRVQAKVPWLPWSLAAAIAVAAATALWAPWRMPAPAPDVIRLEIPAPDKTVFDNAVLLSPDGRQLAFTTRAGGEGGQQIWVRSIDALQARPVAPWTTNPVPFWSSDSRFIAFQENGKLRKVDITGGPPITLSDAPSAFAGGAWRDDIIVLGNRVGGLMQVPSGGGVPVALTTLDEKRQETLHGFPSFLPDGKHFIYLRRSANAEYSGIYIGEVGTAPDHQDTTRLIATDTSAVYTPAPDLRDGTRGLGFLLFLRDGTLLAQPFDAARLALEGEPVPIAEKVAATPYGFARFSVSERGGLAASSSATDTIPTRVIWVDRQGKHQGGIGQTARYGTVSLSPDGSRVAVETVSATESSLWLIDATPGGKSDRFTFGPRGQTSPVWSPDGSHIVFTNLAGGSLFVKPSNLSGDEVELFQSNERKYASDWSRDGKTLVFTSIGQQPDVWSLALAPSGPSIKAEAPPTAFLKTTGVEFRGKLSPDGRWMAYASNATGRFEVYVRPFPVSADRRGQQMVSNGGGDFPVWRRDGKELFYLRPPGGPGVSGGTQSGSVMAVDVVTGTVFTSGQPTELFALPSPLAATGGVGYIWDVKPDGSRFLLNVRGSDGEASVPITWVLNWPMALKK